MEFKLEPTLKCTFQSHAKLKADHKHMTANGYIGSFEEMILLRIRNLNTWREQVGRPLFPEQESLDLIRQWEVQEANQFTLSTG